MQKYPYQTCIRLPENLRDSMQTICDQYQINESDLMRKAIVQFVEDCVTSAHMAPPSPVC